MWVTRESDGSVCVHAEEMRESCKISVTVHEFEDSCIAILSTWIDGAGKQPKTWTTVSEAFRLSGFMEAAAA